MMMGGGREVGVLRTVDDAIFAADRTERVHIGIDDMRKHSTIVLLLTLLLLVLVLLVVDSLMI